MGLESARDLSLGAAILETRRRIGEMPVKSMLVLLAFGLELYIKYMIQAATGRSAKGHDLERLYGQLQADIRQAVEFEYRREEEANRPGQPTRPVAGIVHTHRSLFTNIRYDHEAGAPRVSAVDYQSLRLLCNALDRVAEVRLSNGPLSADGAT